MFTISTCNAFSVTAQAGTWGYDITDPAGNVRYTGEITWASQRPRCAGQLTHEENGKD